MKIGDLVVLKGTAAPVMVVAHTAEFPPGKVYAEVFFVCNGLPERREITGAALLVIGSQDDDGTWTMNQDVLDNVRESIRRMAVMAKEPRA